MFCTLHFLWLSSLTVWNSAKSLWYLGMLRKALHLFQLGFETEFQGGGRYRPWCPTNNWKQNSISAFILSATIWQFFSIFCIDIKSFLYVRETFENPFQNYRHSSRCIQWYIPQPFLCHYSPTCRMSMTIANHHTFYWFKSLKGILC